MTPELVYSVSEFYSSITVLPDGVVDVAENITVQFIGLWQGIYRSIPVHYVDPHFLDWSPLSM